jgi:hypothetical protein
MAVIRPRLPAQLELGHRNGATVAPEHEAKPIFARVSGSLARDVHYSVAVATAIYAC